MTKVTSKDNGQLAMKLHKEKQEQAREAKDSTMKSLVGYKRTVTIAKGTDHSYKLTLRFPGVVRASEIEDNASNVFNNITVTGLMQEAIKDVIVSPHIKSLDFFNEHAGFSEASAEVLRFLNEGLNGEYFNGEDQA